MSIKLKRKKNLSKRFIKIAEKMIDKSIKALTEHHANNQERVHNARKCFKEIRGLLRLIRYGLGEKIYKQENVAFRDAGRPLSAVRDGDVLIETLDQLIKHFQDQISRRRFEKLRKKLYSRKRQIRARVLKKGLTIREVLRIAKTEKKRIGDWPLRIRWKILNKGLRKTYEDGQNQMLVSWNKRSDKNLHEWRKFVKYLRYQLELLESLWPAMMCEMAGQARQLADQLGLDHDLTMLEELVNNECSDFCSAIEGELLLAMIHERRAELQNEAMILGQRLYTETGKQFADRMTGYWKSWEDKEPIVRRLRLVS